MKSKDVFYDFGTVQIGYHAEKVIKVFNDENETLTYDVHRDKLTNPLDYVFEVKPYSSVLNPGSTFNFTLSYKPIVPNVTSCDYFSILSTAGVCMKIGAKGKCIGPSVYCDDLQLIFLCENDKKECQKTIKLRNPTDVPANFQFDIDEVQSIFKLNKLQGVISPHKHLKIEISFQPRAPGRYSKRLFCLLAYQRPLMIEVIGLCIAWGSVKALDINVIRFPDLQFLTSGYSSYLSDTVNFSDQKPLITFSENCFDFGHRDKLNCNCIPHAFSVTNHTKGTITLEWDLDVSGIFSITPRTATISSEHSALFQAYFRPDSMGKMYHIELEAYAFWGDSFKKEAETVVDGIYQVAVPIHLAVRMLGNTLLAHSATWTPHCEVIPQKVVLPACLPMVPTCTTLTIVHFQQLPLMFRFLPPTTTNFTVKPIQGIITGGFQIIVVQIFPENQCETAYVERWGLQFNGSHTYEIHVDFQAYAEYPNLHIGRKNLVVFPATFPGCDQMINVPVRNATRHSLSYIYHDSDVPENIKVLDNAGVLVANEIKTHLWQFTPQEPGEHLAMLKFESQAVSEMNVPLGRPIEILVMGYGYSEYVELVALPEMVDFDISAWGSEKSSIVRIYNFGNCQIHYTLKIRHSAFIEGTYDVIISPMKGTLGPGDMQEANVNLKTSMTGLNIFAVTYDVRRNADSDVTVRKITEKVLFTVQYMGVFPTLVISDIQLFNGGPVLSKAMLWEMLNINGLNDALLKVRPGEMLEVPAVLPTAPSDESPIHIAMLLENHCETPVKWIIKRTKNCDCKLVNVEKYLSFRRQVYDCPHRLMQQIYPESGNLEPKEKFVLKMWINYILQGKWLLKHVLNLPNNRSVMISSKITVLHPQKSLPSCICHKFDLKDTWIGDEEPVSQVYWLYNNGHVDTSYEIDVTPINGLNYKNYCLEIMKIYNPKGKIKAKSVKPVFVGFKPVELKSYEVICPMKLGDQMMQLKICGNGTVNYNSNIHKMRNKMPDVRRFYASETNVLFSVHHIILNPMTTFSTEEYTFFIENISKHIFEIEWQSSEIPGVLEAKVFPQKFHLRPEEINACKLSVSTLHQPCLITFPVTCKLINVTDRQKHGKSMMISSSISGALEGQFTITSDGMTVPICDVPIKPKPIPEYTVISVTSSILSKRTFEKTVSLQKQKEKMPDDEAFIMCEPVLHSVEPAMAHIVVYVLEMMIWETVHSQWFLDLLDTLRRQPTPYYRQFLIDPQDVPQFTEMTYLMPSRRLLESVFNTLIYEVLNEEFNFATVINSHEHHEFIRQYKRSSSQQMVRSVENIGSKVFSEGRIKIPSGW